MIHKEIEKLCDELIKKPINDSAGTADFAVTYTLWNPVAEFVLTDTDCGRKSATAEVIIGVAVYDLSGSYRRLVQIVAAKLELVLAPVLNQGGGKLCCERILNGVSLRFEVN